MSWKQFETIINSLDNQAGDDVNLDQIDVNGNIINRMLVSGGKDNRVALYYYPDPYDIEPCYILLDCSQSEPVELVIGGAKMPFPKPERAVSKKLALEALEYFYKNQEFPSHLDWELIS